MQGTYMVIPSPSIHLMVVGGPGYSELLLAIYLMVVRPKGNIERINFGGDSDN